jgi:hypothetical protein
MTDKTDAAQTNPEKTGKRANGRNTPDDLVTMRRERVAALRARGLSLLEILNTLSLKELPGLRAGESARPNPSFFPNPATGEGFDRSTLFRDIQWCEKDALKRARRNTDKHRAQQLTILEETLRVAWSKGKIDIVLRTVEVMAKLTGTIVTKIETKTDEGQFANEMDLARDQLRAQFDRMAERLNPPETTPETT